MFFKKVPFSHGIIKPIHSICIIAWNLCSFDVSFLKNSVSFFVFFSQCVYLKKTKNHFITKKNISKVLFLCVYVCDSDMFLCKFICVNQFFGFALYFPTLFQLQLLKKIILNLYVLLFVLGFSSCFAHHFMFIFSFDVG